MGPMQKRPEVRVRYRTVGDFPDPDIHAVLHVMRAEAVRYQQKQVECSDTKVLIPAFHLGSARETATPVMGPQTFLCEAHKRSLQVTRLKNEDEANLREEYRLLLSEIPQRILDKVGDKEMDTLLGRAKALTQLVSAHAGEIVELDRRRTTWHLRRKPPPGSASAEWRSAQWHCLEGGWPVRDRTPVSRQDEYGRSAVNDVFVDIGKQAKEVAGSMRTCKPRDLHPEWKAQVSRLIVPCRKAEEWQWHRAGPVITLGELFLALGKAHTAAAIYSFYRTCRLVAIKKKKDACAEGGVRGSRGATVAKGSGLQADAIGREYYTNQDLLVDEYVKIKGYSEDDVRSFTKEQLLANALQFMYRLLLEDIRPPWRQHSFPQALPGESVLCKFTRPSFLQWGADETATLFGDAVHSRLCRMADAVSFTFAGIIARPLYVCTEVLDNDTHELCMKTASMSRFLKQPAGRPVYKCSRCIAWEEAERARGGGRKPGSASVPLRALWAYPLVQGMDVKPTPLRVCGPVRLVVRAPPASWGWFNPRGAANDICREAKPEVRGIRTSVQYWYNAEESAEIWRASGLYGAGPVFAE